MEKKTRKNKKNGTVGKLISIGLVIISIGLLSTILGNVYNIFVLQKQAALVESELASLRDENASLNSTKEKLEDPDYIQTYARGEYMFSKGDEKIFYLPGN
ncbi:MAG: septum formation initiator family protein [Erysipelotrichaceae bacterium]|nr:septum formation initiator family protein [Erysipelotrichaceae bacterium]